MFVCICTGACVCECNIVSAWLRAWECVSMFVCMYVYASVHAHVRMCSRVRMCVCGRARVTACACTCVNAYYASFYHRIDVIENMQHSLIN